MLPDDYKPAGLLTTAPKLPDKLWVRIMRHGHEERLDVFNVKPEIPPEIMDLNTKLIEINIGG